MSIEGIIFIDGKIEYVILDSVHKKDAIFGSMIRIIFLELLLIAGSVFIYRSLWLWLDQCPWLSTIEGSVAGLIMGVVIVVFGLSQLNTYIQKK